MVASLMTLAAVSACLVNEDVSIGGDARHSTGHVLIDHVHLLGAL